MTSMDASPEYVRWGKWKRRFLILVSALAVVAICVAIRAIGGRPKATAQTAVPGTVRFSGSATDPTSNDSSNKSTAARNKTQPTEGNPVPVQNGNSTSSQQDTVAVVNGEEIKRQELAQECLTRFGNDVLEAVINKNLILTYCEKRGIKISNQDVDEEIARMAKQFSIPVDQWMQMLKQERGIKPEQYADDIIRPTLALRKLASEKIQPTQQEMDEAYEAEFGIAVKARLIVLDSADKAKDVLSKARANPANFEALARKYSIDGNSASLGGLIQPIRKHIGDPDVERMAFSMKEGDVSPVIEVHKQFVILKCEGRTQPAGLKKEEVRGRLEEFVRDRKLRTVATDVFKKLQEDSEVVNVYNDPNKRSKMPGVAATINGKTITIRDLSEACIARHGEQVLDQMIQRRILEQELKRRHLAVTQQELDSEVARAAISAGKMNKNGKPDVEGWLKTVTSGGTSLDKYMHDSVWPSTALKLIAGDVQVTDEDIDRGYKSNYGPKAQIRAIVLDSQRRAQEVWQKARDNPSVDFFGKLAEQYSIEPASRTNEGRVPPMRQYSGQPDLEREAFRLKPGEMSGIVQVGDKYVILYLESYSKPVQVGRDEVKSLIYEDVHEKKMRVKMTNEFDRLKDDARIDNYLAGTSQTPQRNTARAGQRSNDVSASGPPGKTMTDEDAVPAAYQSTGLLPKSPPSTSTNSNSAVKSTYGPKADAGQSRSDSSMQR
jgi:parvulin-like peptidyl-prolyl isomerase